MDKLLCVIKQVLFFLTLIFVYNLSYADLNIIPSVINIVSDTMSVYTDKFIVTNTADNVVMVVVSKEDWKNFSLNPSSISVKNWLQFEKDKFFIAPKESVEVPFKVVPDKEMIGSVSGMVVFTVKNPMINFSMKQPVYVVIDGTQKIDFNIDSLILVDIDKNIYYKMVVKNDGNVHIRHNGVVEFYNKKTGNFIKSVVIDETFPVYAESSRAFSGLLLERGVLKKGKYVALFKISALGKEIFKELNFKVLKSGKIVVKAVSTSKERFFEKVIE